MRDPCCAQDEKNSYFQAFNFELTKLEEIHMAVFTCEKCGHQLDTRCKPQKCPQCGEMKSMCKAEAPKPAKAGKK